MDGGAVSHRPVLEVLRIGFPIARIMALTNLPCRYIFWLDILS